jgi:hypothetical protein
VCVRVRRTVVDGERERERQLTPTDMRKTQNLATHSPSQKIPAKMHDLHPEKSQSVNPITFHPFFFSFLSRNCLRYEIRVSAVVFSDIVSMSP